MDFNVILAQLRNGHAREARAALEAARAAGEDTAAVNGLLARACLALGDRAGARYAIAKGLELDQRFVPLWLERAVLARADGNGAELLDSLRSAHALAPEQPAIALDLARALLAADAFEDADRILEALCRTQPTFVPAWLERGELALRLDNPAAAEQLFAHAQRLAPAEPAALRGLADAADALGKPDGERWARERLVALAPGDARAIAELGDALRRDDRADTARERFANALALRPGDPLLQWLHLNTLPNVVADAAAHDRLRREWDDGIRAVETRLAEAPLPPDVALGVLGSATNFYRHYLGEPLLEPQRAYGRVLRALAQTALPGFAAPAAPRRARRRIAFVSSHFHEHTVWKLFRCWLEALDRRRFELVAVHLDEREDAATQEARRLVDAFVHCPDGLVAAANALQQVAADTIVHLDPAMHPHGQALAALRLAPLQCVAWGHPITTGLDTIDLFLSSDAMEPDGGATQYSERLVRLPGLGISVSPSEAAASALPAAIAKLDRYLFCAQSAQKLTPVHDAYFADLLTQCPHHSLVLVPHDKAHVREALAARIRSALVARGIDAGRLVVLPALPHAGFIAVARGADAVVDSLDWSGGMTTLECLSVGTPVFTAPGDTMRSRHSTAMVQLLGRPELVARDRAALTSAVAAFAQDASTHDRATLAREAREAFAARPWQAALADVLDGAVT